MEKATEQIVREYSEVTTELMTANQHSRRFKEAQKRQENLLTQASDEALQAISLETGIAMEELKEWRILLKKILKAKSAIAE